MKNLVGRLLNLTIIIGFLLSGGTILRGQVEPVEEIKVDTTLVNIPVIVTDQAGRRVPGLRKEDFRVMDGANSLEVAFFADNSSPMSLAILLDTSGSTGRVLGEIKAAARKLVDLLSDGDEAAVWIFDERISKVTDFTSNKSKLRSAILSVETQSGGGPLMNQAIEEMVSDHLSKKKGRKAILVLSDGGEIDPSANEKVLKSLASTDVVVYPVFFQSMPLTDFLRIYMKRDDLAKTLKAKKSISMSDLTKLPPFDYLDALARNSGGRFFVAEGEDFSTAFLGIVEELRRQYVLGFYPTNTESDAQNRVEISLNRPGMRVRTKGIIRVKASINN